MIAQIRRGREMSGISSEQARTTGFQLASELRRRRRELGLTQEELAELAGVSTRFLHDLENAKPSVQLDRVLAVAETLGLELHWRVHRPDTSQ
jgi:y4mF family transcriptional regulator